MYIFFSGFSRKDYRALQRMETFTWRCNECSLPVPPPSPSFVDDPLSSTTLGGGRHDEVPAPDDVSIISPEEPEPMDTQTAPDLNATFCVDDPSAYLIRPTPTMDVPQEQIERWVLQGFFFTAKTLYILINIIHMHDWLYIHDIYN